MNKKNKQTKESPATNENQPNRFDPGESALEYSGGNDTQRMNLDLPRWAMQQLDEEAARRGVARQALVKMWLIDEIDELLKEKRDKKVL